MNKDVCIKYRGILLPVEEGVILPGVLHGLVELLPSPEVSASWGLHSVAHGPSLSDDALKHNLIL